MKLGKLIIVIKHWIPLGITITALCGLIYLAVQQDMRLSANDPQIQIVEDLAANLTKGETAQALIPVAEIDISRSLAPFIIIYDNEGRPVASSAVLKGRIPSLPPGVFTDSKQKGQLRFTWQPEPGIRSAAVITHFEGAKPGFVLAARSLREVRKREDNLLKEVVAAWVITLAVTFLSYIFLKSE